MRQFPRWLIERISRQDQYRTLNHVLLSRAAALHNVQVIRQHHPDQGIIPVLKSNAYGHGLREMAQILNNADCELLAVDGYFEAARIRHITRHRILVLGYILPSNACLLDIKRCSFVVQDEAMLAALGKLRKRVRIHLELNTGMNRLGLNQQELPHYLSTLKRYPNLELEGIMSHLADADNPTDDSLTERQVNQFDQMVEYIKSEGFEPKYIHIAQTAGSTKAQSAYANALRLGLGLYGLNPLVPEDKKAIDLEDLQPVLTLRSTIIKVIELKRGDTVGYNATFRAEKPTRIGVLPIGYYEGVARQLSNRGIFTAGAHQLPIVGRISMNHTMVDLGDSGLSLGQEVTVFSPDSLQANSISTVAAKHSLFIYSLLTDISNSIRRQIV